MTQIGNSGRLAARASILQDHIDGVANVHEASAIILDPPIEVNLDEQPNVRFAITALTDFIDQINIDANTVERGFITLANDLGGTGSSPNIIKITGDGSNQLNITPRNLVFDNVGLTDIEIKYNTTSTDAKGIKIISQSSTTGGFSGGDITIQTGNKNTLSTGAKRGKIFLNLHTQNVLTAKHITNSSYIISLFGEATTDNITGQADKTVFFFDAGLDPNGGYPVGGALLYCANSRMRVYNESVDPFNIGDTPAEWINNLETLGAVNKVTTVTTQGDTAETLCQYEYTIGTPCTIFVECDIIAALDGDSHVYKYYASFYSDNGTTFNEIGSNTQVYSETDAFSPIGTDPSIVASGNSIFVLSGHDNYIIKWYGNTKLHIIEK